MTKMTCCRLCRDVCFARRFFCFAIKNHSTPRIPRDATSSSSYRFYDDIKISKKGYRFSYYNIHANPDAYKRKIMCVTRNYTFTYTALYSSFYTPENENYYD